MIGHILSFTKHVYELTEHAKYSLYTLYSYHAGGWGKPPVDEAGKPLYGDVFGTSDSAFNQNVPAEEIDTSLWGELESESEEEEDSDDSSDEEGGEGEAAEDEKKEGDQSGEEKDLRFELEMRYTVENYAINFKFLFLTENAAITKFKVNEYIFVKNFKIYNSYSL